MNLIWSPEALQDLRNIRTYISQEDPKAAKTVVERILALVSEQLPANPESGRLGRVLGTRELVVSGTPFVIPYQVRDRDIIIYRVYHSARMWPESF